ncbi:MAG: hypothetical protein P8M80_06700 [Pirellulaceae bacterium]|nr:hypothetical protein [Pirellulaceae bacterium]
MRQTGLDGRQDAQPVVNDRQKVQRRRLIDPTTCERDYSNDEIEFMQSMDEYKRRSGRMFPTCSEILEVVRDMGYVRVDMPEANVTVEPANFEEQEQAPVRTNEEIAKGIDASDLESYGEYEDSFEDEGEEEFGDDFDDE